MAASTAAQSSGSTQPWMNTGQWWLPQTMTFGTPTGPLPIVAAPLAVDSSGDMLVANALVGFTAPTKTLGGTSVAPTWVSKVNASGVPMFGVQIGGTLGINLIGADNAGDVLIAGTSPSAGGLPVTPNAYSSSPSSGNNPAYACKLSSVDGTPVFCTYLNVSQVNLAGIGADAQGNVYILAGATTRSIVTTPGALTLDSQNVVVLKVDPTGQKLLYSAAFGGNGKDNPLALSVDAQGDAYIIGETTSTNFPGTAGGAITTPSGSFVAKVNPAGSEILYASYGRAQETPEALGVDLAGAAYVSGTVGTGAIYVRKYSADGTAVDYETVLPGSEPAYVVPGYAGTYVSGASVDGVGILTMFGYTNSIKFPVHSSLATCPALNSSYPAVFPTMTYMLRLAADGSVLQSTFFLPTQLGLGSGSIISTQQDVGWVAGNTATQVLGKTVYAIGVIRIGPDSTSISPVNIGCVANGAALEAGSIAPGEIITIFGSGLGPVAPQSYMLDSSGRVASTLAGVQVNFDGTSAPLLYVQDGQINAITPWGFSGKLTTEMCVIYNQNQQCVTPSVGAAAAGVFVTDYGQTMFAGASGNVAAVNQDGTLNSTANPAPVGSIVSIYATGLGPISPTPIDGSIVQLPLPVLANPVQILFAGQPTNPNMLPPPIQGQVLYAGPAPLEVGGLFQINVRIPSGTTGRFEISLAPPFTNGQELNIAIAPSPAAPP
jgi:uncharacterized protein (TIGR03437 family)